MAFVVQRRVVDSSVTAKSTGARVIDTCAKETRVVDADSGASSDGSISIGRLDSAGDLR